MPSPMQLKVLLPFQVFAEVGDVLRIVAETPGGSFGLLPRRLDCAAALVPGILMYESAAAGVVYLAVDQGMLVKTGAQVLVSVRRALVGADLGQLRAAVEQQFKTLDQQELDMRSTVRKLEASLLQRAARHGRE